MLALLLTTWIHALDAGHSGPTLIWHGVCPQPEAFASRVGALDFDATVVVEPSNGALRLDVKFISPDVSTRTLRVNACADAVQAALLLLRLGARPAEELVAPQDQMPPPLVEARPAADGGVTGVEWGLSVAFAATVGAQPAVTPRAALRLTVDSLPWLGWTGVRTGVPARFSGGPTAQAGFVVHPLIGAELGGCWAQPLGPLRLGPCLALQTELLRLEGQGVSNPQQALAPALWVALDARVATLLAGRVLVAVHVGPRFALLQPEVVFQGYGSVFRPPTVSGEASVSVGFTW